MCFINMFVLLAFVSMEAPLPGPLPWDAACGRAAATPASRLAAEAGAVAPATGGLAGGAVCDGLGPAGLPGPLGSASPAGVDRAGPTAVCGRGESPGGFAGCGADARPRASGVPPSSSASELELELELELDEEPQVLPLLALDAKCGEATSPCAVGPSPRALRFACPAAAGPPPRRSGRSASRAALARRAAAEGAPPPAALAAAPPAAPASAPPFSKNSKLKALVPL